jgi:hypothetical protein
MVHVTTCSVSSTGQITPSWPATDAAVQASVEHTFAELGVDTKGSYDGDKGVSCPHPDKLSLSVWVASSSYLSQGASLCNRIECR